jgi:hypothetical protein
MQAEHHELHVELEKATMGTGKVAVAAQAVAKVLHEHFEKEEAYALPPLGLLPALARGEIRPEMDQVLAMTGQLKAELPQMLEEHKAIVAALEDLAEAARSENRPEVEAFTEKLKLHAQTEEEVSYPTSILVGEYLKLKLNK